MLWKVLSIFSALALAAGAYFANVNRGVHAEEKLMGERSKTNLQKTESLIKEIAEVKTQRDAELKEKETQLGKVKEEVSKTDADTTAKQNEVELLKKSYEEVAKQLTQLDEQIKKYGDFKLMVADIEKLNKEKEASVAEVANKDQQLAFADEKIKKVAAEVVNMAEVQKRMRAGVLAPDFTARVTAPFNEFGFVILNKGNLGGMIANAMLDVKRGRYVVAKLKVRDVEQGTSVADVIPGTLAQGETIRPGDLVVAAPLPPPPPAPAPGAAPAPDATPALGPNSPPPAGMAAPGTDPFGAPPAGGMNATPPPAAPNPATADPFGAPPAGGMAPTAPAPAPAPSTADPFGAPAGGMAPTTPPVPGGTADPFAPAPKG
jgi:hypothetical protein